MGIAVLAIVGMYPFDWEALLGVSLQNDFLGQAGVDMAVLSLLLFLSVVSAGILSGCVPWAMLLVGLVGLLAEHHCEARSTSGGPGRRSTRDTSASVVVLQ